MIIGQIVLSNELKWNTGFSDDVTDLVHWPSYVGGTD